MRRPRIGASQLDWPGRKQVYRRLSADGKLNGDVITVERDCLEGSPLLVPVMQNGRRLAPSPSLTEIRRHAELALAQLPDTLRQIERPTPYDVQIATALTALAQQVDLQT